MGQVSLTSPYTLPELWRSLTLKRGKACIKPADAKQPMPSLYGHHEQGEDITIVPFLAAVTGDAHSNINTLRTHIGAANWDRLVQRAQKSLQLVLSTSTDNMLPLHQRVKQQYILEPPTT